MKSTGATPRDVVAGVCSEFEVSQADAEADVAQFINSLLAEQLVSFTAPS
jgi:hypothetical protein